MQAHQASAPLSRQLSLNLSDGFFVSNGTAQPRPIKKTITFPKHITIPHFGAFQRQVNALFAPFGIVVEFSLSRQKRLQMTWIFPPETPSNLSEQERAVSAARPHAPGMLSDEEVSAFTNVIFAFAGQTQG